MLGQADPQAAAEAGAQRYEPLQPSLVSPLPYKQASTPTAAPAAAAGGLAHWQAGAVGTADTAAAAAAQQAAVLRAAASLGGGSSRQPVIQKLSYCDVLEQVRHKLEQPVCVQYNAKGLQHVLHFVCVAALVLAQVSAHGLAQQQRFACNGALLPCPDETYQVQLLQRNAECVGCIAVASVVWHPQVVCKSEFQS
jgi:hypothetical protein